MALNRKGQLAMFIMVGVLLVVIIGLLIYSGTTKRQAEKEERIIETAQFPSELQPVGVFVQECLEQEAGKTINVTALQGGRPLAPRHPYSWNNMTLSHGYYMGLNELPALEEMQNEMAGHLKLNLNGCIANLWDFKARGMDLEYGDFEPKFTVGSDMVIVDLNFPITLKKDTGEVKIEKFSAEIPSRLGYLHDAARRIVDREINTIEGTTLNLLSTLDVWANIYPQNLSDNIVLIDKTNQTQFFYFINSYRLNENPLIEDIYGVRGVVGEEVSFYVNATDPNGDNLTYSDKTDLFDIDPKTGLVSFVPDKEGYYFASVRADDGNKGYDEKTIPIEIVKSEG